MELVRLYLFDVAAILLLTFAIYMPRHQRRDMLIAFLGINVGVLAVTQALSSAEVSSGLGLGLFGLLSIIRLRSTQIDHDEVSYYFAALALGLLGGFPLDPAWLSPVLMGTIVCVLAVADHPRLFGSHRHQVMTLDRAFTDERAASDYVAPMLSGRIRRLSVVKVDLVHETTIVDVYFEQPRVPGPLRPSVVIEHEILR